MNKKNLPPNALFWSIIIILLVLDQGSKFWAESVLRWHPPIFVLPGLFDMVYVQNTGVAFGFMQNHNFWLAFLTPLILVVGFVMARECDWSKTETNVIASLLCSGALGNWCDRLRLGYVVDFLDFYVGHHHWPAFNVADSCLCVGVAWILMRAVIVKD